MANSRSVFFQLLQWIPKHEFEKGVDRYRGDRGVRRLSCWSQFVGLLFGQLTGHNSLRAIEAGFQGVKKKLYHLGIAFEIHRSTLSDANDSRDARIFESAFYHLLPKAQRLAPRNKLKLKGPLLALDATTIELCLSLSPWARFHHGKGAMKLHIAVDLAGDLPTVMVLTEGRKHDVPVARTMRWAPGTVLIMDRAYVDFEWMWELTQEGVWFVTRIKKNCRYKVRAWRKTNRTQGILCDQTIRLQGKGYEGKLRKVSYRDPETGHKYVFLTNRFDLAAKTICDLYKARWQVELFFKTMKQQLQVKKFLGTSVNAVKAQVWVALIAYLLLAIVRFQSKLSWGIPALMAALTVVLFSNRDLESIW
ncbi:MAG: IS4 family transposase, partial [Nitrospiria bacterium]